MEDTERRVSNYLAIFGQVDLQCLSVIFKPGGSHCKENIFTIDCFPLLLLALF